MVHNSKARISTLEKFIQEHACEHRSYFTISDVKFDGTVFVKFKSRQQGTFGASATEMAQYFHDALTTKTTRYTWTTDVQFRVHLEDFEP